MSENSSSNKLKNIPGKKNVSYSTDYHVNLLEASDKLIAPEERVVYTKLKSPDNTSESDDFNSYITDNKKNVQTPHKNTNYSDNSSKIEMSKKYTENFASDINKSIFLKALDFQQCFRKFRTIFFDLFSSLFFPLWLKWKNKWN